MKVINQSVELIKEEDILKKIELAGRTCYNSQHLIKEGSAIPFVDRIVKSGHTSVLEHGTIGLIAVFREDDLDYFYQILLSRKGDTDSRLGITVKKGKVLLVGNLKAWLDFITKPFKFSVYELNGLLFELNKVLISICPTVFKEDELLEEGFLPFKIREATRKEIFDLDASLLDFTFKIVTTRDITHQLVRHRTLSFSQQSQRYCNFSKDKFEHSIDFIIKDDITDNYANAVKVIDEKAEDYYMALVESGVKPEQARAVLTNSAASIIYVSGNISAWAKFNKLRGDEHAQIQIQEIAHDIEETIDEELKKFYN